MSQKVVLKLTMSNLDKHDSFYLHCIARAAKRYLWRHGNVGLLPGSCNIDSGPRESAKKNFF